jgi:ATP-binding cassette subfamily B protein
MDHGRIAERGSHRELLARDDTYAHLWNLQLQEQKEEEQRLRVVGSGCQLIWL